MPPGKPVHIYIYAKNTYEDLQDLLKLTLKEDVLFIKGDWNAKVEVKKHLE